MIRHTLYVVPAPPVPEPRLATYKVGVSEPDGVSVCPIAIVPLKGADDKVSVFPLTDPVNSAAVSIVDMGVEDAIVFDTDKVKLAPDPAVINVPALTPTPIRR